MIITADWETFFSDEYSLKKMTTEAYVRDPRFKPHGLAIKFDDEPAKWIPPEALQASWLRDLIEKNVMLAHHAHFDGLILWHHFGLRPAFWLDTLSMARVALPHERHSLDNLSKLFNLPGKQYQMLADVKGVRDPNASMLAGLGAMACDDANKTKIIFEQIKPVIPREEFRVIDMTVRMFTEPCLQLDVPKMERYYAKVRGQKQDALTALGLTKKDLGQDETVASKYRELGVEPDAKITAKGNKKYAFAKTDQFMRDMLEDEDERVVALTEARLGIKSSQAETRCERLLGMATRGSMCVYLRYAGAHTTRWSGGDKTNWQNFQRQEKDGTPGEIRGSILAPPGTALVVADAAQIECRIVNWLAGQWDILDLFRNKLDPYSVQASRFYGRTITKADKLERHLGKTIELGCLGPDTKVLTDQGYIRIVDVTTAHRVWDGEQWVTHQGLLNRGVRSVITLGGLKVTPDHRVLCGNTWVEAQNLLNESTLYRALERGSENLPLQGIKLACAAAYAHSWFNVAAERLSILRTRTTFSAGKLLGVIRALKKHLGIGQNNITDTPTWFLRTTIENAYLTAFPPCLTAAQTQNIGGGETTVVEGSLVSGRTAANFLPILLRCREHLTRVWSWIASTTAKVMSRETFGLLHTLKTHRIDAQFTNSNELLPTFDLLLAGPNNRFTVATDVGPLIVHNCGFGMGAERFRVTCANGPLGGAPIYLSEQEAIQAVEAYRQAHPAVKHMWYVTAEQALDALAQRKTMDWGPLHIEDGAVWLPNGLPLWYDNPEIENGDRYFTVRGRRSKMYGGKLVENVVQALARVVLSQAMLRLPRYLRVVNCTHDEIVALATLDMGQQGYEDMVSELKRPPVWAPTLPLDAEGFWGERYSK